MIESIDEINNESNKANGERTSGAPSGPLPRGKPQSKNQLFSLCEGEKWFVAAEENAPPLKIKKFVGYGPEAPLRAFTPLQRNSFLFRFGWLALPLSLLKRRRAAELKESIKRINQSKRNEG